MYLFDILVTDMRTSVSLFTGHNVFNLLVLNRSMEKQWTVRRPLLPALRDISFSLKTSGEERSQSFVRAYACV